MKKDPNASGAGEKKDKPPAGTPQRKPSNTKLKEGGYKSGEQQRLQKHHSSSHTPQHHQQQQGQQQQNAAATPGTASRYAMSSYQNAPDAADVPKPSLGMLANAKQARSSWVPTTLPQVPIVETSAPPLSAFQQANNDQSTQEMTANLMKMLGIGSSE